MRYFKILCTIMIVTIFFWSLKASAGISGSKHDFHSASWNTNGEICQPCHTPHNASTVEKPLWNHQLSTQSFTVYTSTTTDATIGAPSASSKLCLSCHDGVTAIDNFGGRTDGVITMGSVGTGSGNLGTALTNDHPVSFAYDAALFAADAGLKDPASAGISPLLKSGKVECSSCHDVHNTANRSHLLVVSNASSALCLTCHNK
ncbi:MAG: cytochrome c3 family protein [Candidatus Kapabacteria bacterium]|nr:cytochrome c3 family protein [Candidatus Kapabacteria bacterium]